MSELLHPPIEHEQQAAISLHRVFAEEACLLLKYYGKPYETIENGVITATTVTERVDMRSEIPGSTVAMRLRTIPAKTGADPTEDYRPSKEYIAILMEHTTFAETDEYIEDDEMHWVPYVLIVIGDANQSVDVLNGSNGQEVNDADLIASHGLLGRIREELRNERYEHEDPQDYLSAVCRKLTDGRDWQPFESAGWIDSDVCIDDRFDSCQNPQTACNHSPYSAN